MLHWSSNFLLKRISFLLSQHLAEDESSWKPDWLILSALSIVFKYWWCFHASHHGGQLNVSDKLHLFLIFFPAITFHLIFWPLFSTQDSTVPMFWLHTELLTSASFLSQFDKKCALPFLALLTEFCPLGSLLPKTSYRFT